jgi:hypothetical protein
MSIGYTEKGVVWAGVCSKSLRHQNPIMILSPASIWGQKPPAQGGVRSVDRTKTETLWMKKEKSMDLSIQYR